MHVKLKTLLFQGFMDLCAVMKKERPQQSNENLPKLVNLTKGIFDEVDSYSFTVRYPILAI